MNNLQFHNEKNLNFSISLPLQKVKKNDNIYS